MLKPLAALALTFCIAASCSRSDDFSAKPAVGTMPKGFAIHEIASPAAAAEYARSYARVLGLEGLTVYQVADLGSRFWVYVDEEKTGRGAFALEIRGNGEIASKSFPGMEPEMMWNQKYGHEARPDPSEIRMDVDVARARDLAQKGIPEGMALGNPKEYYGYYLFPLMEGGREVGEAAVNGANGAVAWGRWPDGFRSLVTGKALGSTP